MTRDRRPRQPAPPLRPKLSRSDIPRAARIFVNRNLKMSSVRVLGFDMDHTVAVYKPEAFERLAYDEARKKLVELGYADELLSFEYDHAFVIRGLVVDKRNGNILKMDRHHHVSIAYHGLSPIDIATRRDLYKGKKVPLASPDFASIDTLFALPEVLIYAQLVDLMERRASSSSVDYAQIYIDVRTCVDEAHRDGTLKTVIMNDPQLFVEPDEILAFTFDKLRRHGKKLFLLTNSEPDYTETIMSVLLNNRLPNYKDWKQYFDIIGASAGKPSFFYSDDPLIHATGPLEGKPATSSDKGKFFLGGSAREFEARLGYSGDRILYFGDHTYGDILRSKSAAGWRTAMIVHELEHEIASQKEASRFIQRAFNAERVLERLIADRDLLEIEMTANVQRYKTADMPDEEHKAMRVEIKRLKKGLNAFDRRIDLALKRLQSSWQAVESVYHPTWGSLFKCGGVQSRFGAQVTRFACVYTSRASNFYYYPVSKLFKPNREMMPHELDR